MCQMTRILRQMPLVDNIGNVGGRYKEFTFLKKVGCIALNEGMFTITSKGLLVLEQIHENDVNLLMWMSTEG